MDGVFQHVQRNYVFLHNIFNSESEFSWIKLSSFFEFVITFPITKDYNFRLFFSHFYELS